MGSHCAARSSADRTLSAIIIRQKRLIENGHHGAETRFNMNSYDGSFHLNESCRGRQYSANSSGTTSTGAEEQSRMKLGWCFGINAVYSSKADIKFRLCFSVVVTPIHYSHFIFPLCSGLVCMVPFGYWLRSYKSFA